MAKVSKRRERYVLDFYDSHGKRQRQTLAKGTTLKKAKDRLREIEDRLEKGNYIPDKKVPKFEDVAKDWLEYKKVNLRESTWSVYEGHTRNHFGDLNNLLVNRISTPTIEKFIIKRQKDGMKISTLRRVLVSLGQIMQYAVRHKYIDHNPVRDAEKPRGQGGEVGEGAELLVLSPIQINALLDNVSNYKYKVLFMFAIFSGARQGEILGLKWSDFDWENSQIRIRRTFNNKRFFDVKTKASRRSIDLGPNMLAELKKWKIACPPNELDLVFPNNAGNPINHNNMVNNSFIPALKKARLPIIRFHDMRHTKASIMIEQGENIKYIQSQLGHSSPTITLNVYAHLMKPVNQEAACRYENLILNQDGHNLVTNNKKGSQLKTVTP
jgi:integrase